MTAARFCARVTASCNSNRKTGKGTDEVIELSNRCAQFKSFNFIDKRGQHGVPLQAGQSHADTCVHAVAETEMRGDLPGDVEVFGPLPMGFVSIC